MQVDYHLSAEVKITNRIKARLESQAMQELEVRSPWNIVTWVTKTDTGWTFSAATLHDSKLWEEYQ
jgi:hypothetical protein